MTEPEDPSRERLKHHFAQRVIHQARQILEIWQRLQRSEWSTVDLAELSEANLRLLRFAERFEQPEHTQLARHISQSLEAVDANRGRLSSGLITDLNRLMQRLSRTGLRHGDQLDQTFLPPLRKPIYVMLQDHDRAERLRGEGGIFADGCRKRVSRVDQQINAFCLQIIRKPLHAAKTADAGGKRLGNRIVGAPGVGKDRIHPCLRQGLGQTAGLCGAAQNKNARHV